MAFEVIGLGLHKESLSMDFASPFWAPESRTKATSMLYSITDFEFIVTFVTVYHFFSHLAGITVKMQGKTLDIVDAYNGISSIVTFYRSFRQNIDNNFYIFEHTKRMATVVNVEPSKPRSCSRQRNRPNVVACTVEEWYKINVAIPFIDHIISDLESHFSSNAKTVSSLLCLVPSLIVKKVTVDFADLIELYNDDLPSPELFSSELALWKHMFTSTPDGHVPSTCSAAMKICDELIFPNVFVLLKIACIIPVTSCECERNANTVRRLCNYMRCTMTEERFTSLALMHIHYNHKIDLNEVIDLYNAMHPRRLRMSNILVDS